MFCFTIKLHILFIYIYAGNIVYNSSYLVFFKAMNKQNTNNIIIVNGLIVQLDETKIKQENEKEKEGNIYGLEDDVAKIKNTGNGENIEIKMKEGIMTISEHRSYMESLYNIRQEQGQVTLLLQQNQCEMKTTISHQQTKETKVHEELLIKQSVIFSKILKSGFEESKTKCIDMKSYDPIIVQDFVKFIYLEVSPNLNYYLSRPTLLFAAIRFCQQFLLENYSNVFINHVQKIISSLNLILDTPRLKESIHYHLFESFNFQKDIYECSPEYENNLKSSCIPKTKLNKNILKCMHFIIVNSKLLIELIPDIKVQELIWKSLQLSNLRDVHKTKPIFKDWFVEIFETEFRLWIKENLDLYKEKVIDLLICGIITQRRFD